MRSPGPGRSEGGDPAPGVEIARRLADRYVLSSDRLRRIVPAPPLTTAAGRALLSVRVKRGLLAIPAVRRAVAARRGGGAASACGGTA